MGVQNQGGWGIQRRLRRPHPSPCTPHVRGHRWCATGPWRPHRTATHAGRSPRPIPSTAARHPSIAYLSISGCHLARGVPRDARCMSSAATHVPVVAFRTFVRAPWELQCAKPRPKSLSTDPNSAMLRLCRVPQKTCGRVDGGAPGRWG